MKQRFYFDTSVFGDKFDYIKVDILVSWNFKYM